MKKMLSLVLALLLLMMCPAMAETAVEMQTMTSPDGNYSFEVPQGYFTMDAEILKTLFATEQMQQFLAQVLGLADASQLSMYFDAMQEANMMIVYTDDMAGNLNVQVMEASLTMDMVVALKGLLDQSSIQQYEQMGIAAEDVHPMEIQQFGNYKWYGVQLVMAGLNVQSMLTIVDGMQYTLTFTSMDAPVIENVLESFTLAVPAAE